MTKNVLLQVDKLIKLYNEGVLGGENMPEQEDTSLDIGYFVNDVTPFCNNKL